MSDYITIYTDGSWHAKKRFGRWAYIVVKNEKVIDSHYGYTEPTHRAPIELAESTALLNACQYCKENKGNYIIITDSKTCVEKINKNCANASGQPNIKGIQNILNEFKNSIEPISLSIKFKKRNSNKFMVEVDRLSKV